MMDMEFMRYMMDCRFLNPLIHCAHFVVNGSDTVGTIQGIQKREVHQVVHEFLNHNNEQSGHKSRDSGT